MTGTIVLNQGVLPITASMTISSPDASKLSISGAGAFSILDIDGGGDDGSDSLLQVTIAGLTFTDADGNAIDNHENTTLANVIISGNSGELGNPIMRPTSAFSISTISGNTNPDQSRGGGIYNTGSLKLMNWHRFRQYIGIGRRYQAPQRPDNCQQHDRWKLGNLR